MELRSQVVLGLITVGGGCLLYSLAGWARTRFRSSKLANPSAITFGSDDPPPAKTIEFNESIISACGRSLTPEQKLKMLTTPGITKAGALEFARKTLEDSITPRPTVPA